MNFIKMTALLIALVGSLMACAQQEEPVGGYYNEQGEFIGGD